MNTLLRVSKGCFSKFHLISSEQECAAALTMVYPFSHPARTFPASERNSDRFGMDKERLPGMSRLSLEPEGEAFLNDDPISMLKGPRRSVSSSTVIPVHDNDHNRRFPYCVTSSLEYEQCTEA